MRSSMLFDPRSIVRLIAAILVALGLLAATAGLASAQPTINVALNKPVTAETDITSGTPQDVVDGSYSTVWYSYQGYNSTISFVVDLEGIVTVQGYRLQPSQTQDYAIFTSLDGTTWTQRYVETDWLGWPDSRVRTLTVASPYQARYVRYVGKNFGQTAYVGVVEFEVWADPAQTTYPVTATAGTGGTASCTPNPVPSGGTVTCTATPDAGFTFSAWTGACAGQGAICTLSNITAVQSSAATFARGQPMVQAVPTLSEWGVIGIALLLAGVTALGLRRR